MFILIRHDSRIDLLRNRRQGAGPQSMRIFAFWKLSHVLPWM